MSIYIYEKELKKNLVGICKLHALEICFLCIIACQNVLIFEKNIKAKHIKFHYIFFLSFDFFNSKQKLLKRGNEKKFLKINI